jgi:hypothetical protein
MFCISKLLRSLENGHWEDEKGDGALGRILG